jgi:radical SAM superfamily enzyme YgiQ (UPF0313 family)
MGIANHAKTFAPLNADGKRNLIGLGYDELTEALAALGFEKFRAKQIWSWMYHHGATDFAKMTTLAKPARDKLAEHFTVSRPAVSQDQKSADGTRKWLLKMIDGQEVECVHIPEKDRGALCVSSQVGCTLTCGFCHTGTQRLVRNLEASEIIMQVMLARDMLKEWPEPAQSRLRPSSAERVSGAQSSRALQKSPANIWLSVSIREGKNREVRKAMEHIGLQVTRLIRVSFGPFQLGKLPRGGVEEVPRRVLRESLGNFFENAKN